MKHALIWIVGCAVLIVACIALLSFRDQLAPPPPGPPMFSPVIKTIRFDDGSTVEFIQIAEKEITDLNRTPEPTRPIWMKWTYIPTSSSSGAKDNLGYVSIRDKRRDGMLRSVEFRGFDGLLLVELKMTDSSGDPVAKFKGFSEGKVWHPLSDRTFRQSEFSGVDEMINGTEGGNYPDVLIQIADSEGNWHSSEGPTVCETSPDKRGAIAFKLWPRGVADLRFRAIRTGIVPVEFTLPNPAFNPTPKPWTPEPLPATYSTKDYTLTFKSIQLKSADGVDGLLSPKLELTTSLVIDGEPFADAFSASCTRVDGCLGSQSTTPWPGFQIDPGEQLLRFHCVVHPSHKFPYLLSDSLVIGSCVVDELGNLGPVTIRPGTNTGIQKINVNQTAGDPLIRVNYSGAWNSAAEEQAANKVTGGLKTAQMRIFVDDETWSNRITRNSGERTKHSAPRTTFEVGRRWHPRQPIRPGQTIRFALVQPRAGEKVTFIVDRSSATKE